MWGGITGTGDYNKKAGVTKLEVLDPLTEKWVQHALEGHIPTRLYDGASTSVGGSLYGYAFNTVVHLIFLVSNAAINCMPHYPHDGNGWGKGGD